MGEQEPCPWLYAQDAFWEWMQQDPALAHALRALPTQRQAGYCMVCGRETSDGIVSKWDTFTDWSVFRLKDSHLVCPACYTAKVYGHVGQQGQLVIQDDGRPGNGRSYSMLFVQTATGIDGKVPWDGAWWTIPDTRPLMAMIVRGDNPSRQHWLFHASVSRNAEVVILPINDRAMWLPQAVIQAWGEWMAETLVDPQALAAAQPPQKGKQVETALTAMPWAEAFMARVPLSLSITPPLRGVLASLARTALQAAYTANTIEEIEEEPV